MKIFKHNVNTTFLRICRIQINSPQRNQNIYPNHYYKLTIHTDEIYNPGSLSNTYDKTLEIYCNKTSQYFYTNSRNMYYKLTNDNDNVYLDIGMSISTLSTNITCDIETINPGSVTTYLDSDTQSNYTKIDYYASDLTMAYKGNVQYVWLSANAEQIITVPKSLAIFRDLSTSIRGSTRSSDIFNGDNSSFTITELSSNDFNRVVKIAAKRNCPLYIETV